jgi:hypothetical protein
VRSSTEDKGGFSALALKDGRLRHQSGKAFVPNGGLIESRDERIPLCRRHIKVSLLGQDLLGFFASTGENKIGHFLTMCSRASFDHLSLCLSGAEVQATFFGC